MISDNDFGIRYSLIFIIRKKLIKLISEDILLEFFAFVFFYNSLLTVFLNAKYSPIFSLNFFLIKDFLVNSFKNDYFSKNVFFWHKFSSF